MRILKLKQFIGAEQHYTPTTVECLCLFVIYLSCDEKFNAAARAGGGIIMSGCFGALKEWLI